MKKELQEAEELLAQAERYRAYMDRIRFTDPEAKEQNRRLKTILSTGITALLVLRNLVRTTRAKAPSELASRFSEAIKLFVRGLREIKIIHRDLVREFFPDEITRMREHN